MDNPFDQIMSKLNELDSKLTNLPQTSVVASAEIIDTLELRKRLSVSEPTIIKMRKSKKIPSFRLGSSVRFNWTEVVNALEKTKSK